ncbi:hypothetical protein Hdeb2414_s0008g00280261 [Helianthus debilis subsp. tardiflorus]
MKEEEARGAVVVKELKVVNAILEAPENTAAVEKVTERARETGFKAGYNQCLNDVNTPSPKHFTDERCALRDVDTEAAYSAVVEAYNGLIIPALEQIEACLEVDNYISVYAGYSNRRKKMKALAVET